MWPTKQHTDKGPDLGRARQCKGQQVLQAPRMRTHDSSCLAPLPHTCLRPAERTHLASAVPAALVVLARQPRHRGQGAAAHAGGRAGRGAGRGGRGRRHFFAGGAADTRWAHGRTPQPFRRSFGRRLPPKMTTLLHGASTGGARACPTCIPLPASQAPAQALLGEPSCC